MKIGILGGTFDPIHRGHLQMAVRAHEEYNLDQVWLMPTGHSPHKNESEITSAKHRLAMIRLAIQPYPYMLLSTFETDDPACSYTCRTLRRLHAEYPQEEFYFIMGADSLACLDHWVHPEIICRLAVILAAERDGWDKPQMQQKICEIQSLFPADIRILHGVKERAASRDIRSMLEEGKDVADFIPSDVCSYIQAHGLYTDQNES